MRNHLDITGYGLTPADERMGALAGLLAGLFLVACAFAGAVA